MTTVFTVDLKLNPKHRIPVLLLHLLCRANLGEWHPLTSTLGRYGHEPFQVVNCPTGLICCARTCSSCASSNAGLANRNSTTMAVWLNSQVQTVQCVVLSGLVLSECIRVAQGVSLSACMPCANLQAWTARLANRTSCSDTWTASPSSSCTWPITHNELPCQNGVKSRQQYICTHRGVEYPVLSTEAPMWLTSRPRRSDISVRALAEGHIPWAEEDSTKCKTYMWEEHDMGLQKRDSNVPGIVSLP